MKIVFLTSSSRLPEWLEQLSQDYIKKLSYWFKTEIKVLSSKGHTRTAKEKAISDEESQFLSYVKAEDFLILCDESGVGFDSIKFSKKIENILATGGKKRLIILIGGAYGVGRRVQERADLQLKLSQFTMSHHLALSVIFEQVYRAVTLIKGVQYHNA